MPSSVDETFALTISGGASSDYTLGILTWTALFITPLVILYQGWTYWVFRQRISSKQIPASIGLRFKEKTW